MDLKCPRQSTACAKQMQLNIPTNQKLVHAKKMQLNVPTNQKLVPKNACMQPSVSADKKRSQSNAPNDRVATNHKFVETN